MPLASEFTNSGLRGIGVGSQQKLTGNSIRKPEIVGRSNDTTGRRIDTTDREIGMSHRTTEMKGRKTETVVQLCGIVGREFENGLRSASHGRITEIRSRMREI